jgi:hypothetical protein
MVEAQRGQLLNQDLRISWFADNRGIYDFAVELLAEMGRHEEAFEISERARSRALLDAIAESVAEIREGVPAALLEQELRASRTLAARAERLQRLFSTPHSEREGEAARRQFDQALAALAEAQDKVRAASPAYANLVCPEPASLAAIRGLLDPHTVLVEFYVTNKRVFAYFLSSEAFRWRTFSSRSTLDSQVRQWLELLTARNREIPNETLEEREKRISRADREAAALSKSLSRELFGNWIDGRRIVLVVDGPLHYVPFAALVPERVQISRAPSASTILALRSRQRQPTRNMAVIADPVYQVDDPRVKSAAGRLLPDYARLRFSRLEAERISALDSRPGNLLALDFSAQKSILRKLDGFRFVHRRPTPWSIRSARRSPDWCFRDCGPTAVRWTATFGCMRSITSI